MSFLEHSANAFMNANYRVMLKDAGRSLYETAELVVHKIMTWVIFKFPINRLLSDTN
jgi:hypothetical protein